MYFVFLLSYLLLFSSNDLLKASSAQNSSSLNDSPEKNKNSDLFYKTDEKNNLEKESPLLVALKLQKSIHNVLKNNMESLVEIYSHKDQPISSLKNFSPYFFFSPPIPKNKNSKKLNIFQSTGFFINSSATILTSYNSIKNSKAIFVVYKNIKYNAKILAKDLVTNIALIELEKKPNSFNFITLKKDVYPLTGEFCIAISNPLSLNTEKIENNEDENVFESSFSTGFFGIISHNKRTGENLRALDSYAHLKDLIQTDLIINDQSEGSPLFNIRGDFIGMNVNLFKSIKEIQSIGFAISSDVIHDIVKQLLKDGKINRSLIGIEIRDLDEKIKKYFGLKNTGVLIAYVNENSPAKKGGVKKGDIAIQLNGKDISSILDFTKRIFNTKANTRINLVILRNGTKKELSFKTGSFDSIFNKLKSNKNKKQEDKKNFKDETKKNNEKQKKII